jgi:hypothetical protein
MARPSRTVQTDEAPSPDGALRRRENHEASSFETHRFATLLRMRVKI